METRQRAITGYVPPKDSADLGELHNFPFYFGDFSCTRTD